MSLVDELGASTLDRKLELHGTIGEGGMGVVRLGTQRALSREVAVKTLKPEHKSDRAVLKLLREAWVTGALDHPNVVPVYDLAIDGDGSPLVVLKKIEGVDWATLMHDARTVRDRFGADDLLEWNLRTFLSVCNAVRFAHSRRVLHRDLKPENVMIGQFGEVYLVDWGIAVSLEDDGSGRMPLASDAIELAGTPIYMAPEMLGGKKSRLSERTDLYLLGAILYEIVAGRPPHRGGSFMELVAAIVASDPDLPEGVPEELARIIRRAMDPDPDARFENAEQVRLAVEAFLQHRSATRLAERAEARFAELLALLAVGEPASAEQREAIYRLFGECRFGFRHALEVWPDDEATRRSLDRAIAAMVEHELLLGAPEAAHTLLAEMEAAPVALAARVEEGRRAKAEQEMELRKLHADLDVSRGRRTRLVMALVMGLAWTVFPAGANYFLRRGDEARQHWVGLATNTAILILLAALWWWGRESMMRTAINRRLGLAAWVAMGLELAARMLAVATAEPVFEALHPLFLVWSAILFMLASSVDRRLWVAGAGYLVAYLIVPSIGFENLRYAMSGANAMLLAVLVLLWSRPPKGVEAAPRRPRTPT
jgi:serine/threonine-protein kinase